MPQLAAELVTLKPAVIVALVTQASLAAREATSSIPIVMVAVGDPIGSGLVTSLGRPGGNVTGNSSASVEVAGKSVEILKEIAGDRRRVATPVVASDFRRTSSRPGIPRRSTLHSRR